MAEKEKLTLVHRTAKSKDREVRFTSIDNALLQNHSLTYRARGLLAFVLSCPTQWTHNAENLAGKGDSTEGPDSLRAALRELQQAGHAHLEKVRDEKGHVRHRWRFFEEPSPKNPETAPTRQKRHSAPSRDLPPPGQPPPGQPPRYESTINESTINESTINESTVHFASATAAAGRETLPGLSVGPSPPQTRPRNELFDALVRATGSDPMGMTERAKNAAGVALAEINKAKSDLTPAEIERRAENYRRHFTAPITPNALAMHWAKCANPPESRANRYQMPALTDADHEKGFFHGTEFDDQPSKAQKSPVNRYQMPAATAEDHKNESWGDA